MAKRTSQSGDSTTLESMETAARRIRQSADGTANVADRGANVADRGDDVNCS